MARAATPAIAALVAAGVPYEVLTYHHDPRNESFGDEAVAAAYWKLVGHGPQYADDPGPGLQMTQVLSAASQGAGLLGVKVLIHGLRTKDWRVRLHRWETVSLAVGIGLVLAGVALVAAFGRELVVK